jgi:hypothetical protein
MRIIFSRKQRYIEKLIERANYHDDLAKRLDDEGDSYASDMAKVIADVFRLVVRELDDL